MLRRWKTLTQEEKVNRIWFILKWYFTLSMVSLALQMIVNLQRSMYYGI